MAYLDDVQAVQQQDSAELYTITYSGRVLRVTSYFRDVVVGGVGYLAVPLERSELAIEFGPEEMQCTLRGSTQSVFAFLKEGIPPTDVEVTIARYFFSTASYSTLFFGRMTNFSISGCIASVTFCSTLFYVLQFRFDQLFISQMCHYTLFDARCGLNADDWRLVGRVVEIGETDNRPWIVVENSGGNKFGHTVQSVDEGYFSGSVARLTDFYRYVLTSENADAQGRKRLYLQFAFPPNRITIGTTLRLWPGCDKMSNTCYLRFGNYENFAGQQGVLPVDRYSGRRPHPRPSGVKLGTVPKYYGLVLVEGVPAWQFGYQYSRVEMQQLLCQGPVTKLVAVQLDVKEDAPNTTLLPEQGGIIWHADDDITQYFSRFHLGDGPVVPPITFPDLSVYTTPYEAIPQYPYVAWWLQDTRYPAVKKFPANWLDRYGIALKPEYYISIAMECVPTTPWSGYDRLEYSTSPEPPPGTESGVRALWVGVNAVSAIYDILTNTQWGAAVDPAKIDTASFAKVAKYCYDKDYGVAFGFTEKDNLRKVVDLICEAAGLILCAGADGRIKCVAVNDISAPIATITDEDMIESTLNAESWDATKNSVVVENMELLRGCHIQQHRNTINDRLIKQNHLYTIDVRDDANITLTGSVRQHKCNGIALLYYRVPQLERAREVLYEYTYPRTTLTCKLDHRYAHVSVGDCVRVESVQYAISGVYRVLKLTYSDNDSQYIQLELRQVQESVFNMDYVMESYADGYDEGGAPIDIPAHREVLTFQPYSDTSETTTTTFTNTNNARAAWFNHPVLQGEILLDVQDAVNYQASVNAVGGGKISITLRSPQMDDVIQSNATGGLQIIVWEAVS